MRRKPTLLAASALLAAALLTPAAQAGNGGFAPVAPQSPNADSIHQSYLFISIFAAVIFVMVETILLVFVFRYRRRKRPRFEDGAPIHGATNLELLWTAFPVVVLFVIATFIFVKLPGIVDVPSAGRTASSRSRSRAASSIGSSSTRTVWSRSTRCARPPASPCI